MVFMDTRQDNDKFEFACALRNGDTRLVKEKIKNLLIHNRSEASILIQATFRIAAIRGYLELLEYCLSKGADINALDSEHMSALMHAVIGGHQSAVEFLLKSSAKIHEHVVNGYSILSWAEFGDSKIAQLLLDHGASHSSDSKNNSVKIVAKR